MAAKYEDIFAGPKPTFEISAAKKKKNQNKVDKPGPSNKPIQPKQPPGKS